MAKEPPESRAFERLTGFSMGEYSVLRISYCVAFPCLPAAVLFAHTQYAIRNTQYAIRSHQVPQLLAFGFQIFCVVRIRRHLNGHLFDDLQAVTFEADDFLRIVREQTDGAQTKVHEDLRAEPVLAQVHFETQ